MTARQSICIGLTLIAVMARTWADQPSVVVKEPSVVVKEPGVVVKEPSLVVKEPGVVIKQDDIQGEPFKDAKTVGKVDKGEAVTILGKQGGWLEIQAAAGAGWVRLLSVRKGTGQSSAAAEIAGGAGVATGRAGTGQVVSTAGVRGLGEADLKSARFNLDEVKKAEAAGVTAEEAGQYAAQGALVVRQVGWLPAPKNPEAKGR